MLKIYEDSKNYTCQVIKLPPKQKVKGLDNLVQVTYQGNDCLISKDSNEDELYLFFPVETQLSHDFCAANNLYRHSELNNNPELKGFFEDTKRVKCVKFKGITSTGFIIPINSLNYTLRLNEHLLFKTGDEFNELFGVEICKKYINRQNISNKSNQSSKKLIDSIVDSKQVPEHFDTEQLMKNIHKLNLTDYISVTHKLHGTSARYYNCLTKRKLNVFERILRYLGCNISTEEYNYITGSRKVLKSLNFESFANKKHYYSDDLWSKVGKKYFENKLNQGESVYCEIIGCDYSGKAIQGGYTYGFKEPTIYIYRISNINSQGIEVDLSWLQLKIRCNQLDIPYVPELYYGKMKDFLEFYLGNIEISIYSFEEMISRIFINDLLEQPSILDKSVVEEGFCIRIENYPKPYIYKIKSKKFLLHESKVLDVETNNIEDA